MGKSSCSQDPTHDTKLLFNFNIWVGYGLSLDHTGQTKLYKPQQKLALLPIQKQWMTWNHQRNSWNKVYGGIMKEVNDLRLQIESKKLFLHCLLYLN